MEREVFIERVVPTGDPLVPTGGDESCAEEAQVSSFEMKEMKRRLAEHEKTIMELKNDRFLTVLTQVASATMAHHGSWDTPTVMRKALDLIKVSQVVNTCESCGKSKEACEKERDEIDEQRNQGCCEFGPDCDGTQCGLKAER